MVITIFILLLLFVFVDFSPPRQQTQPPRQVRKVTITTRAKTSPPPISDDEREYLRERLNNLYRLYDFAENAEHSAKNPRETEKAIRKKMTLAAQIMQTRKKLNK